MFSSLLVLVVLTVLAATAGAADLGELEGQLGAAEAEVATIEGQLEEEGAGVTAATKEAERWLKRMEAAAAVAIAPHEEVERLTKEIEAERRDAAAEIRDAEAEYEDSRDSQDQSILIGIICIAIAAPLGVAYFCLRRFRKWPEGDGRKASLPA